MSRSVATHEAPSHQRVLRAIGVAAMKGWFMVAFLRDLAGDVTPVEIGRHRLMIVRRNGTLRAFNATCPHRGALLACGGRLVGDDYIQCPFHGYPVQLGGESATTLRVAEHAVLSLGGMVFIRIY
jgi:3-ketosteroid 9alpha-monooxygenase subunit A